MKYYKTYGYNASYAELWRISGKNPLKFLIAIILKITKSRLLVSEHPDTTVLDDISYDQIPYDIANELSSLRNQIEMCNYSLALVHQITSGSIEIFGLVFIYDSSDRYIHLFYSRANSKLAQIKNILYAIVSIDSSYNQFITTNKVRYFDPLPSSIVTIAPKKSLVELNDIHSDVLKQTNISLINISTNNIKDIVIKREELAHAYQYSRGIVSEKYEK